MMKYKEFKRETENRIQEFIPEDYKEDLTVKSGIVQKVNMSFDALYIDSKSKLKTSKYRISPTIYIDQMYQDYIETEDFEGTMKTTVLNLIDTLYREIYVPDLNLETVKDQIVYQLVNTAQNSRLLENAPHRSFLDLSIVYSWIDERNYDYKESMPITNMLAQRLGISEEGLYELAKENTCRIYPTVTRTIEDIIRSIMGDYEDIPSGQDKNISKTMWVLSNKDGLNGAAAMLDNTALSVLSSILDSDLYILPSSVHEVIAIPALNQNEKAEELAEMVHDINKSCVKPTERLSNQVYRYDRAADKVILVTNTNKKLLDDIAV